MPEPVFSQAPTSAGQPAVTQKNLLSKFPSFPLFILLAITLAIVHYWQPDTPINWAVQGVLFLVGAILGHVVFLFEPYFGRIANTIGEALANNRLVADLPATPNTATSLTDTSPLKQGLILFLLPIFGVLLLSTSRWAIGLGFLFGVSWVYFADILGFLRNQPSEFPGEYFPPQQAQSRSVQTALIWYGLYMLVLVVSLLL